MESPRSLFSRDRSGASDKCESEIKALHAKIGELAIEKDFLSKALGRDC